MVERFREPIDLANSQTEVYRVGISPTFENPVLFRIAKDYNGVVLISKRISGQGGYDPGRLKQQKTRKLSNEEWNQFLKLLEAASFWNLPTDLVNSPDQKGQMTICLDGTDWLIEGHRNNKYHGVVRYCPESTEFMAVGRYLLNISGLKLKRMASY